MLEMGMSEIKSYFTAYFFNNFQRYDLLKFQIKTSLMNSFLKIQLLTFSIQNLLISVFFKISSKFDFILQNSYISCFTFK